jgi:hypothetical protein
MPVFPNYAIETWQVECHARPNSMGDPPESTTAAPGYAIGSEKDDEFGA